MTLLEQVITIGICALGTMLTRFLPFWVFSEKRPIPKWVQYLGDALPMAIFAMLVVYCLKDMSFSALDGFLPHVISVLIVVVLHVWRRNTLLSIVAGTLSYMLLLQLVF